MVQKKMKTSERWPQDTKNYLKIRISGTGNRQVGTETNV